MPGFTRIAAIFLMVFSSLAAADRPLIVVTIKPLALLVEDLVGDNAQVEVLLDGAASPHHFQMRVSQRKLIGRADMLVWVGPTLETFLKGIAADGQHGNRMVQLDTLSNLRWPEPVENDDHHHDHAHHHGPRDPHLWLDLHNVDLVVEALSREIGAAFPEIAKGVEGRAASLRQRLAAVYRASHRQLQQTHAEQQSFMVYHDSFGHLANSFNLQVLGSVTLVPGERTGARTLHQLQKKAEGAACLAGEASEKQVLIDYGRKLGLPPVDVDILALSAFPQVPAGEGFVQFYRRVMDQFLVCFS